MQCLSSNQQQIRMSTKSKIIKKFSKVIKNQGNHKNDNKCQSLVQVEQKSKTKQKKGKNNKLHKKNRRSKEQLSESSENVMIDVNLGQYGFDKAILPTFIKEIQPILQNCELFAINPNSAGLDWRTVCQESIPKLLHQFSLIKTKHRFYTACGEDHELTQINNKQYIFSENISALFFEISKGNSLEPGLSGVVNSHISFIRNKLAQSKVRLTTRISRQNNLLQNKIKQLEKQICLKTFINGLNNIKVDELNYFLERQYQQQSRTGRFEEKKLKDWSQWAHFIQKKRVKLRKANKFLLHTGCQLCLSPYFQQQNELMNCPECHIRGHRLCLGASTKSRCGRCIYLRLSNETKSRIPLCYICQMINLTPIRITGSRFAHIFCLMVHGMWTISNESVCYSEPLYKDQKNRPERLCKFCNKICVYYAQCMDCYDPCHYICAYLNGCQFQVTCQRQVKISCCNTNKVDRESLGQTRKFILNYENLVFKKLGNLRNIRQKNGPRNEGYNSLFSISNEERVSQLGEDFVMGTFNELQIHEQLFESQM